MASPSLSTITLDGDDSFSSVSSAMEQAFADMGTESRSGLTMSCSHCQQLVHPAQDVKSKQSPVADRYVDADPRCDLHLRWIPCKLTDLGDGMKLRLRIAVTYDEQFDVRVARLREQAPRLHIRAECTQVLRGFRIMNVCRRGGRLHSTSYAFREAYLDSSGLRVRFVVRLSGSLQDVDMHVELPPTSLDEYGTQLAALSPVLLESVPSSSVHERELKIPGNATVCTLRDVLITAPLMLKVRKQA